MKDGRERTASTIILPLPRPSIDSQEKHKSQAGSKTARIHGRMLIHWYAFKEKRLVTCHAMNHYAGQLLFPVDQMYQSMIDTFVSAMNHLIMQHV
jgi:hypothetical protein